MTVTILGQLNINETEVYVYQFINPSTNIEGLYFSHIEVLPLILRMHDPEEAINNLSPDDLYVVDSNRDANANHIFISAEAFVNISKFDIFSNPNWTDLIHPIILQL